jgi:hypothetical protein
MGNGKRRVNTFDQSLTLEQAEQEKKKNTLLGQALKKADILKQQNKK